MLYWNPKSPKSQFFFNDRDNKTGKVFCVLFDIVKGKRLKEYRYQNTPIGNSGVAQKGGHFLGINYARMARLRPVTGYKGAHDWTVGQNCTQRMLAYSKSTQMTEPNPFSYPFMILREH